MAANDLGRLVREARDAGELIVPIPPPPKLNPSAARLAGKIAVAVADPIGLKPPQYIQRTQILRAAINRKPHQSTREMERRRKQLARGKS